MSADPRHDGKAQVGVLDRNRTMLGRATRIVRAATDLEDVVAASDPGELRAALSPDPKLLLCDSSDLDLVLAWCGERYPEAKVVTWGQGGLDAVIATAEARRQVGSVLAWPPFLSMPRPWELTLAVRRALAPTVPPLALASIFAGEPTTRKFRPRTSSERDQVVAELAQLAERAGAGPRLVTKVAEVGHELLMNAMYDAPVDHYGMARYSHDRGASLALDGHEVPVVRLATDGVLLAVQVSDPFGRLERRHVLASIQRGLRAIGAEATDGVIDASNGGAGLGMWRIYASAAVTVVDVIPGHNTSVTCVFDLDVGPREARTMPTSLHLCAPAEL